MLVLVTSRDIEMAQHNEYDNPIARALKRIARGKLKITADEEEVKISCKAYTIVWKTPRDIEKFLKKFYDGSELTGNHEFKLEVPNPFTTFADETNRYLLRKGQ